MLPPSVAAQANEKHLKKAIKRLNAHHGYDPELSLAMPDEQVLASLHGDGLAAIEVLALACEAYAGRPALGERDYELEDGPEGKRVNHLPVFKTLSYRCLWQRTAALATGLARAPHLALKAGEVVGIHGFGSPDYVVADLACLYAGAVSAVLQLGMGAEDLQHVVQEAALACIISSLEGLPAVLALLPACPSVRGVVVMDLHPGAAEEAARLAQARARTPLPVATMQELFALGSDGRPLAPFLPAPGTDPLATLMYTSGSTGFPKGAMMTQGIWRLYWRLNALTQFSRFPSIGINFYPLSHLMGREAVVRTLVLGGVTHFTLESDLSTLFEDIRLARPTVLALVPRIAEMIHQAYRVELQRCLRSGVDPAEARTQVHLQMRDTFLGDRLVAAVVGSAPTAPEVVAFLQDCFDIPVYEGYGATEGGVMTLDGVVIRPAVIAYELVDVPELGYRLSDRPHPRGELLIKTRQAIPGYLNNSAATKALFDERGFLRTGDIVEDRGPDQFVWVDRKNNVVKLAQGEFVTLWRLEGLFSSGSACLDQVYLYANSQRAYPLAVVVPDWPAVGERLRPEGQATPGAAARRHPPEAVQRLLRAEFNRVAQEAGLRPYEVPRAFLVEDERWTRENGFLTGVNKPARPQLKRKYGDRLEALYLHLEAEQEQALAALGEGPSASLEGRVRGAVAAVLGLTDLDLASGSFRDLGGDSISALALAGLLEQACGVQVPVPSLLNPGSTLQALVGEIEGRLRPDPAALPGFRTIHGQEPTVVRAEELRLERLLSPNDLAEAAEVSAQPLPARVSKVLLTGANGFLGHGLCLAWLEAMAKAGGKVHALVRAADDAAAFARLAAAYRTGDPALERRFEALAAGHLRVHAGALNAPGLGLEASVYDQLAGEVDLIVHAGALVNHVFTYEQLFEPNVLGLVRLCQLALHKRRKRFDFVSTVGVLEGARGTGKVEEQAGVDALEDVWPVAGGYAHGYATSKWAGEVLLKELHGRFGTPVRVFRPSLILPHRQGRGQANAADLLTRLLASVVYTGLAPRSFYAGGPDAKAHFDGLPVDFIAAAMVALSSAGQEGQATFQVSNPHWDDGVSLDTLMDWVASAGYPLVRIPDHAAWFEAFRLKLEALPDFERGHSALPILRQWAKPLDGWERDRIDASRFAQALARHPPAGETGIPGLTEAFLHKYLEDLRALGILRP